MKGIEFSVFIEFIKNNVLSGILINTVASKKEDIQLWSIRITLMFFHDISVHCCEFFEGYTIFLEIIVYDKNIILIEYIEV